MEIGDFEPAYSLIHLRAETTKSKRSCEVAYGQVSAQLFADYLAYRRRCFGRLDGALLRSESRRSAGAPLGLSSWSKIVEGISARSRLPQLATHTFRHLWLAGLARVEWTIDQIAQYAGHYREEWSGAESSPAPVRRAPLQEPGPGRTRSPSGSSTTNTRPAAAQRFY